MAFERQEITAGEAAKILGITRQSVHGRIQAGSLIPAGRSIDGVYIFSRKYIEEVRDNAIKTATETEEASPSEG